MNDMGSPLICYVVNHAAFFVSHRLPIARAAQKKGFRVCLIIGQAGSPIMESKAETELIRTGIPFFRMPFRSSSVNPFLETYSLLKLILKMRELQPDLVHCVSPKGVLYGGMAARLVGIRRVVFAISGMGYVATKGQQSWLRKLIGFVYRMLFKFAVKQHARRFIVQNNDDLRAIVKGYQVNSDDLKLIPGSGVELSHYSDAEYKRKKNIVLFPARLLRDKGVVEFLEAARICAGDAPEWLFALAGADDYHNPSALSRSEIQAWAQHKNVEFLGHVDDMVSEYKKSSIVCLPSYREGMPKSLLEAAAAGCAVITTDTTGCREAVIENVTGLLVPVGNSESLAAALMTLINDKAKREGFGRAGIALASEKFGLEAVLDSTLNIYDRLLQE